MATKIKGGLDQRLAVSANRLRDGRVVWRTRQGWSETFAEAALLTGAEAEAALVTARLDEAAQLVVGAYFVEIDGTGQPLRQRERIRAAGRPTVPFGLAA